jgi:signal transduction histidine kinase
MNGQDLDFLSMEGIETEMERARDEKDWCYLGKLHLERASRDKIIGTAIEYILDDLERSESNLKFCPDSIGYFLNRLEYAEVLYTREIKVDFAITQAEEALDYFTRQNDQEEMINANYVLAELHARKFELNVAKEYIGKASEISSSINDSIAVIKCRLLGSKITSIGGNPDLALISNVEDFNLGCTLFNLEDDNKDDDNLLADIGLSIISNQMLIDKPEAAISYLANIESLNITDNRQLAKLYKDAINAHKDLGNYEQALDYSEKHNDILSLIREQEGEATIGRSYEKAQREKAEEQLDVVEDEKENLQTKAIKSNVWNFILGIAILASFLAIYYIIRFYNQKIKVNSLIANQREEIDKQRIVKLENNMKIQSLSSMVAGQEAERNRIASDLHDSLGGTLSALKLQFEHVVMDSELSDERPFHHIYKLIDGACSEVREIARNLKPASLDNIGLEAAIRDLINKYNANSNVDMSFNTYVKDIELDYDTKLNLYRIIQELLNNVIKHADATEVDVQLSKADEELIVKVEDDGKGFNINWVKKGLGLDSMQSRVNVLKGDLNIDTTPGRGTSVIIHIPISRSEPSLA